MAILVLTGARIEINNVDLSDHVKSVTIDYGAEILESTAMGVGFKQKVAGLKDWSVSLEFNQDYAAGKVDATIFPLVGANDTPIKIRPTSAVIGPTNPEFQGVGIVEKYPPISGNVGEISTVSLSFQGSGILTRATA